MSPDDLRSFRRRFGLSQSQLARQLRVLPRTVQRWEQGLYPIPLQRRLILARVWLTLARQRPGLEPCPVCFGCGMVPKKRHDDVSIDDRA